MTSLGIKKNLHFLDIIVGFYIAKWWIDFDVVMLAMQLFHNGDRKEGDHFNSKST